MGGSTPAELEQNVEIVDDYTVKLHLNPGGPEQLGSLSVMYGDLMIHSKDFWDAEGKAGYTTKVVGTGAFELGILQRRVSPWIVPSQIGVVIRGGMDRRSSEERSGQ